MKLALVLLVIAPAILAAQQPAADAGFKPISLQQAVALAQQNAPSAVQSRGAIENAAGTLRTTKNQLFPTLTGSLGHSQGAGQQLTNEGALVTRVSRPNYTTGLNASYTVFDGGKRVNDIRARRADLEAAEVAASATTYNLSLQVKQQYYAILAAREAETASRAALDVAQQQLAAAVARVNAGAAIISDSLRSFVAVGNAQLAVLTAQNTVRNASLALTRLTGSDAPVTATASDTAGFVVQPVDSAAVVTLALNGPTVRQAEAAVSAANASVKSARAAYLPSLTASLRYSGSGYDKFYGIGSDKLAYGNNFSLNASLPLWDGRNRQEAVHRAQVTVANNEANLRDARLLAQQNILQQLATLRSAEERIRIQQLSVRAAQEDLRVQQQRYSLGSSTQLEVSTSLNALNAARQALIQARLDYRIARAQIEAIIGQELQ
ncbi:MAG TPA: TolC family protein [Gemmatimonadaceae bacterium]|nr:TolC family protein [Gemmatimonadaceae bacterium]